MKLNEFKSVQNNFTNNNIINELKIFTNENAILYKNTT